MTEPAFDAKLLQRFIENSLCHFVYFSDPVIEGDHFLMKDERKVSKQGQMM